MNWFNELGAKRTPADPDGSKHHWSFIGFVVTMLVLIAVLVAIRSDASASAVMQRGPICRTGVQGTKSDASGTSVTLKASKWCGSTGSHARFDGGAPSFSRSYTEAATTDFNKWFASTTKTGYGTAPNGNTDVQYKAMWVAAEFNVCAPAPFCGHSWPHGVRIWAWANGNYTVKGTTTVPSGMPQP